MNDNNTNTVIGKVLLIYTGGTIGMGRNAETGALEPLNFNHLIERMPEFEYLQTGIEVYQFNPPIDSSNMNPRHWAQLVRIIADRYDRYDINFCFRARVRICFLTKNRESEKI